MDYTFDAAGIAAQRAVCEAATVASWGGDVLTSHWTNVISVFDNEGGASFSLEIDESDRAFIAAARTALPAALDALEAAYAEIARMTAERDAAISDAAYGKCATCKRAHDACYCDDDCDMCADYQWRGMCSKNVTEGSGGNG